jgi:hypothetical protein
MMRLRSRHPVILAGRVVSPGEEFDESNLPTETVERMTKDGRAVPVKAASKPAKSEGSS